MRGLACPPPGTAPRPVDQGSWWLERPLTSEERPTENLKVFSPDRQGQNLAMAVAHVPDPLDIGVASVSSGEVSRGEKMAPRGTDPVSHLTEITVVYEANQQNLPTVDNDGANSANFRCGVICRCNFFLFRGQKMGKSLYAHVRPGLGMVVSGLVGGNYDTNMSKGHLPRVIYH